VVPEYKKWKPKDRNVGFYKNGNANISLIIDHKTGSRVDFITAKQPPDDHEGWFGDMLIIDEPKSKAHYLASARGLIDRDGVDIFCMTMLKKFAWINREIFQGLDKDGDPRTDIAIFHGEAKDNVGYGIQSQEALDRFEAKIFGNEAIIQARIYGNPEYLSDLVFGEFTRDDHIIERDFQLPSGWPVAISIDYHPSKEVAVLFVTTDQYDRKIAFHEIFEHMTPEQTGYAIIDVMTQYGVENVPDEVLIDPLSKGDKNNERTVFTRVEGILTPYDLTLRTAGQEKREKHNGIAMIKELFYSPVGMVNFHVTKNCRRLIFEFENQMIDETTGKPLKEYDDMTECLYRIILQDSPFNVQEQRDAIWGAQIQHLYAARCGGSAGWMGR
ncbi:MAG: hypothetical protein ACC656_10365, partial [Candidatus Heimdallarchaeota archaeon]